MLCFWVGVFRGGLSLSWWLGGFVLLVIYLFVDLDVRVVLWFGYSCFVGFECYLTLC